MARSAINAKFCTSADFALQACSTMLNHSHSLLADIVLSNLDQDRGNHSAVHYGEETWTFGDLSQRAGSLGAYAVSTTDPALRVGALGANHPDWVAAYYGISASGRQLCFLNHRLSPLELIEQINRAQVGLLILSADELARIEPFFDALERQVDLCLFGQALPPTALEDICDKNQSPQVPTWLMFTSGTTGKPKGVLLSHANIYASLRSAQHARLVGSADIYAYPFPLCPVAGYNVPRLHVAGRPVVLFPQFTAPVFIENVERHHVNSATVAATMLASLMQHLEAHPDDIARLATLHSLSYGAAPMPTVLLEEAREVLGLTFSQGFGMSEMAGNALFLDAAAHERGFTSDPSLLSAAGEPGPGVEAMILDAEGNPAARGLSGEIAIRGAQVMVGYLDDPDATAKAVVDGWLHTGDLGRQRPDGIFEVIDRLKDVIVSGGENVASLEVEQLLRSSCPEILDIAVIGVPDPTWGENVCACVVFREGQKLNLDDIAERSRDALAGFKLPRHLVVLDALPTLHSGKVSKAELRRWLSANPEQLGARRGRSASS
jgi:acyl-CoA synthetase (AMP-forming)/AMP-acid ligase II